MEAPFRWREELARKPVWAPRFDLEIDRTALVIVDIQNITVGRGFKGERFMRERYPDLAAYYFARLESTVLPNVERLLGVFRQRGLRRIFLTVGSSLPDGSDFEPLRRSREQEFIQERGEGSVLTSRGADDHAIHPRLAPRADELILNKLSRSAFTSTGIDQILRNMGINGLIFTGVATNACVGATAEDAGDRGYRCVVVEDATASTSPLSHEAALLNFASLYGKVLTTDEVLALLAVPPEGPAAQGVGAQRGEGPPLG